MDPETSTRPLDDSPRAAKKPRTATTPAWHPVAKVTPEQMKEFTKLKSGTKFEVTVACKDHDDEVVKFVRTDEISDDNTQISPVWHPRHDDEDNGNDYAMNPVICGICMHTGEILVHAHLCDQGLPMHSDGQCTRCYLGVEAEECMESHGFACGWTDQCTECGVLVDTLEDVTYFHENDDKCPHCHSDCFVDYDAPDEPDESIPRCKKCNGQTKCYKAYDSE